MTYMRRRLTVMNLVVGLLFATGASTMAQVTRFPAVPTQCPMVRTKCPVTLTKCPPVTTYCPASCLQLKTYCLRKLLASDGAQRDAFGYSVSMSGDTVVVGAPWDDDEGWESGSAYVFVKPSGGGSGTRTHTAKLLASDGAEEDGLGQAVSISGDTVVAGAPYVDGKGTNSGSAYVFVKPKGGWASTLTQAAKLLASDGASQDLFGFAVSISGDTVVVGAHRDGDNGSDSGSVYVFVKPKGGWASTLTQAAKLLASDGAAGDFFGRSVSISGDTIVVGAPRDDGKGTTDSGSAYVFVKPPGGWSGTLTQTATLIPSDPAEGDFFAWSVSISGDTIVASAIHDDDKGSDSGSAYVFVKPPSGWSGTLTQSAKLLASDGAASDYFGQWVSVNEDAVVLGVPKDDGKGSAYVFVKPPSGWSGTLTKAAKLLASDRAQGDAFGLGVSISGDTVVVGAWRDDDKGRDSGSAYVYENITTLTDSGSPRPGAGPAGLAARRPTADQLVRAAGRGDLDRLEELLKAGAQINAKSRYGLTALHEARMNRFEDVARCLLTKGADADIEMPAPEAIADAMLKSFVKGKSPGIAVLAAQNGKILFQRGYGYACLAHDVPVVPETKFRIASVSKPFTAAAILHLQERGKLRVTDKLEKFIPDYPRGDEVTLAHLLTHTSGIHDYTSKPDFVRAFMAPTEPEELIASFRKEPFDFDPGTRWRYSNSGYVLLGHIVAKVSGQSYSKYLRNHFFRPLGMDATGAHDWRTVLAHEATGYAHRRGRFEKALHWDMSRECGDGALYSTVGDLYRWNEGFFGHRVLNEDTLNAAFTPVKLSSGKEHPYGFGWSFAEHGGLRVIAHEGRLRGFLSYLARYPKADFTVVALGNCTPAPPGLNPLVVARRIAKYYLWKKMRPRKARVVAKGIDPAIYDAYVGRYDCGNSSVLIVTRIGDRLFARRSWQRRFEIFPRSETEFFGKVLDAEVTFVKNEKGKVDHAVYRQGGSKTKAPKLIHQIVAKIDPAVLKAYVGKYDYGQWGTLTLTRKGNRLFGQLTGKPRLALLPRSEDIFFWKDLNAEITFVRDESGKVVKGIHTQGGRTFDVLKME